MPKSSKSTGQKTPPVTYDSPGPIADGDDIVDGRIRCTHCNKMFKLRGYANHVQSCQRKHLIVLEQSEIAHVVHRDAQEQEDSKYLFMELSIQDPFH